MGALFGMCGAATVVCGRIHAASFLLLQQHVQRKVTGVYYYRGVVGLHRYFHESDAVLGWVVVGLHLMLRLDSCWSSAPLHRVGSDSDGVADKSLYVLHVGLRI